MNANLKRLLRRPALVALSMWPGSRSGYLAKKAFGPQVSIEEIATIAGVVRKKRPCRLLVFGLGYDSPIWDYINTNGRTVFLEDDRQWIEKIKPTIRNIDGREVSYNTTLSDWEKLIVSPELENFRLDPDIIEEKWDVIFVDAPAGWYDEAPGRMKSIYWASKLLADDGHLLIHDCDRLVEQKCMERYCNDMKLVGQVDRLRHYRR